MLDHTNEARLPRALQYVLVEAHEHGDQAAITRQLRQHPEQSDAIITFLLGLAALSGPEIAPDPASDALLDRALARGMARVATTTATTASLAEALRQAGWTKARAARQLGLGTDVLEKLTRGRIVAATIPARLIARLGELLRATTDEMQRLLDAASATPAVAIRPALRRARASTPEDDAAATPAPESFAEAVRHSPDMTPAARAEWLAD